MSLSLLSYDEFLQIAKNLEGEDIKNLCKINKTHYDFCNRESFWSDLVRINFGIRLPKANINIYNYLKKLEKATIQLPNKSSFRDNDLHLRVYTELESGLLNKFINSLKKLEMDAIINGNNYKYYNSKNRPDYFFRAYSLYGLAFWYYVYEPKYIVFDFPEYYFPDLDVEEDPYPTIKDLLDALVVYNFDPREVYNYKNEIRYEVRDNIFIVN